jgi:hypothetical protein
VTNKESKMIHSLHYLTGVLGLLGIQCLRYKKPQTNNMIYCGWDLSTCKDNVRDYMWRQTVIARRLHQHTREHVPQTLSPHLQELLLKK